MADVFLDLDGTLTDPFSGLTASINYALEKVGRQALPPAQLRSAIGPALVDTFAAMGVDDPEEALGHYRAFYQREGLFDCTVYAGIPEALAEMKADGHRLFLMTAKPHAYATKVTEHFGLSQYLTAEFGPELDGTRNDKAELLAWALPQTGSDPARSIMVGDRMHDIRAGQKNGIVTVAAMWGYGTDDEWDQAEFRCERVKYLPGLIDLIYDDD